MTPEQMLAKLGLDAYTAAYAATKRAFKPRYRWVRKANAWGLVDARGLSMPVWLIPSSTWDGW